MLVTSANEIGIAFLFVIAGKSFMYRRSNMGLNIEPCGTPRLITALFETVVLRRVLLTIGTRWYLPLMYD